jgi:hypothetical protein
MNKQIVPPPDVLQAFDTLIGPLFDREQANDAECRNLV